MFFLAPWIATLLILTLVTLALGLLLPRKEAEKPSLTLTLATGFALLVTIGSLLTNFSFTAKFTTPIVLILTIATLIWKRRQALDLLRNFFEFAILKVSYLLAGLPILGAVLGSKIFWPSWAISKCVGLGGDQKSTVRPAISALFTKPGTLLTW